MKPNTNDSGRKVDKRHTGSGRIDYWPGYGNVGFEEVEADIGKAFAEWEKQNKLKEKARHHFHEEGANFWKFRTPSLKGKTI